MYFVKFIICLNNLEYDYLKNDDIENENNCELWFDEEQKIKFITKYKDKPYKFTLYKIYNTKILTYPITINLVNGYVYKVIVNLDEEQNDYFIYE